MTHLKPAIPAVVDLYRKFVEEEDLNLFSDNCRNDLAVLLGNHDAVKLVEAASTIGNYGDQAYHAGTRKSVGKLLRRRGVRLPRGKRTRPELAELVSHLTPVLLFLGLRLVSNERSKLVGALRTVADELNVFGDPRDTLRSMIRAERTLQQQQRQMVADMVHRAFQSGLRPDPK